MARSDESTIALIILINGLTLAAVVAYVGFNKDRHLLGLVLGVVIAAAAIGLSRLWYALRDRYRARKRA